jgi:hypothetical protein
MLSHCTPEIGKRWLYRPAPGLGGKTPAASLLEGKIDSVLGVLATHISVKRRSMPIPPIVRR